MVRLAPRSHIGLYSFHMSSDGGSGSISGCLDAAKPSNESAGHGVWKQYLHMTVKCIYNRSHEDNHGENKGKKNRTHTHTPKQTT